MRQQYSRRAVPVVGGTSLLLNQALMAAKLFNKSEPPRRIIEAQISRFFAHHAA